MDGAHDEIFSYPISSRCFHIHSDPSTKCFTCCNPGEVVAVALRHWSPQFLTDEKTGEPAGFAIDIMNKAAELSGFNVRYLVCDDWPAAHEALKNKQAVLAPNMGITDERLSLYDFTIPYETFRIRIFVRSVSDNISEVGDLAGRKVGVVKANQGVVLMREQGGSDLQIFDSMEEVFMALISGSIDALVYPEEEIINLAMRSGLENKIKIVGKPLQEIKRGIAVRKGEPELFQKLDNAVRQLIKMREYQMIYEKWYGRPQPFWNATRAVIGMGMVLGLTVACMLVWRYVSILRLNRSLSEAEERFRAIFEQAAVGVAQINSKTGAFLHINKKYADIVGYTVEEMKNLSFQKITHPDDLQEDLNRMQQLLAGEIREFSMEKRYYRKDGTIVWVRLTVAPMWGIGQEPKYNISVAEDITEQKRMGAQLQQAQRMEAIGTLAGGIAHDFNNILSPIIGFSEMLQEDLPQGSLQQESANEILRAALRAKDLVKQILAFSRQSHQELKPVRLKSILKETLKLLKHSIPTTIDIQTEMDSDCGMVVADPTQIHQVIMNLATNAYHAMQESGGQLKIVLKQTEIEPSLFDFSDLLPGKYALLKVIDTGMGIKKEVMDKIFDPYFTTKETGKGTGLGLSVVQGIVKSCHGDIHVYSEPGKGTEVHVYLPIMKKLTENEDSDPSVPIQGGTERLLLVDDEEMIVKMEKQILERLGYHVTTRTGSIEGLEAFKANPDAFDLILSDMTMPNMTGVQFANEIKKIRPKIPVIIYTGFSDRVNEGTIKALGIQGYVMKPVIKKEIARAIRDVFDM